MKKAIAAILIAIFAISTISAIATVYAKPFMNWNNMTRGQQDEGKGIGSGNYFGRQSVTQQSFVRIDGRIAKFGTSNVSGSIGTQSRTTLSDDILRQGASATAMWTNGTASIERGRAKQNFTYTVYTANLVKANTTSLNTADLSFFLNGTWNVFEIKINYTVVTDSSGSVLSFDRNTKGISIAKGAYGELKVASSGKNFTITITGVDDITGSVRVQRITSKMFNPFTIDNDITTTTLTKADVASVVSAYGSSPGWGNYDQRMDYNMHYKIDITDLATAAANVDSD